MNGVRVPSSKRYVVRAIAASIVLSVVAACSREDEANLRARLDDWFSIGETVAFNATRSCAAATFRLVDLQVKSVVPLVDSAPQVLIALSRRGVVALNDPSQAPEATLAELVSVDRPMGMKMRRAALEGRMCMDDETESAFRYALDNPLSMFSYDAESASLMLLDPRTGLLVVAMGAEEWG